MVRAKRKATAQMGDIDAIDSRVMPNFNVNIGWVRSGRPHACASLSPIRTAPGRSYGRLPPGSSGDTLRAYLIPCRLTTGDGMLKVGISPNTATRRGAWVSISVATRQGFTDDGRNGLAIVG